MNNRILLGAGIATLFAFGLYTSSQRAAENRELTVIQVKKKGKVTKQVAAPSSSGGKEPNVGSIEYSNHIYTRSGSNKDLAKQVKKVMGEDANYQVEVQSLTKAKTFAGLRNTKEAHATSKIFELYLLIALYAQEKAGKLGASTAIKIEKSDVAGKEAGVAKGISYGPSYLRQQMLQGSKTAANALLRKIGKDQVTACLKQMGASQTSISGNFSGKSVGKTTAADMRAVMVSLYQGKGVGSYNQSILTALSTSRQKSPLVKSISGTVYQIGDDDSAVALVNNGSSSYVVSVWASKNDKFAALGKTVSSWMSKNK